MIIIVGLGNPGEKYKNTPHNIGFEAVDEFARKNNFPDFKLSKKFNALISESIIGDKKIILAKPQTFMNNSGLTIKKLIQSSKFKVQNYIIVHDDIDLLLGKIKISRNRGSAGHKGVESIINALGTKNFSRIRIGIQPRAGKPEDIEQFVLKKFSESDKKTIAEAINQTISTLENIIKQQVY